MPSAKVEDGLFWSTRTKTWHYHFKIGKKTHTNDCCTANKPLARVRRDQARQHIREKKAGIANAVAPTVQELVKDFLRERAHELDQKSLDTVDATLRLHWQPIALMPADQVHNGVVAELRSLYLAGKDKTRFNRTNGGANKMVSTLSQVFGWAVETRRLQAMPFKIRKLKVEKKGAGIIWPEQIRDWVWASRKCRSTHARLAMLGAMTMGFREGEALGMDWQLFDWVGRRFRVPADIAKDGEARWIPFHPVFERVMRFCWRKEGEPRIGLVLPAEDGLAHREGYLRKPVTSTAKRMGIAGLWPHRLRATFATSAWEAGATLAQITAWMGHESPETTMLYIVQRAQPDVEVQARAAARSGWGSQRAPESKAKAPEPLQKRA